ncbi:MAG: hypothetical protein EOO91_16300 [Pedobacter sp.]|nr:MAG: hypothetical protein EOO91_16300 [Pedobacter sp.]
MKKIMLPLVLLIAGLAIGFFAGRKTSTDFIDQKEAFRKEVLDEANRTSFKLAPLRASDTIERNLAARLIKQFKKENDTAKIPIMAASGTTSKDKLEGFYIDRIPFDKILANKSLTGISFYMAKHPKSTGPKDKTYTLIYIGATKQPKITKTGDTIINNWPAYDYIDPCPTVCGSLRQ